MLKKKAPVRTTFRLVKNEKAERLEKEQKNPGHCQSLKAKITKKKSGTWVCYQKGGC